MSIQDQQSLLIWAKLQPACHTKRREGKEVAIIAVLANRGMGIAELNPTTIKKTLLSSPFLLVLLHNGGYCNAYTIKRSITILCIP
jgi:hypothetical protein